MRRSRRPAGPSPPDGPGGPRQGPGAGTGRRPPEAVPVRQAVQGAEHPLEGAGREDPGDRLRVPVRLAQLQTGPDPQVGKHPAAAVHRFQVTGRVERRRVHPPVRAAVDHDRMVRRQLTDPLDADHPDRVVDVLGERDRGQPQLDGPRAGPLHGPVVRIPGPLTVHVAVRRQGHHIPDDPSGPGLTAHHPSWECRIVTDIRAPAPRASLGTVCCHSCWQAPPMTRRSPPPGVKVRVADPG